MWDLVKGFGALFKARKVNTDSFVFKLHYQATFCMLLVFTLILAANQYVGKPIRCMHHMDEKPDEVLDTYCWIHSTYTVTSAFTKLVGQEVAYPGVESTRGNKENIKVYRFYQWVSFCLFFQALLFYAPRWLWKLWEGGKLQALKMDLDVGVISDEDRKKKQRMMLSYLEANLTYNDIWAYKYYLCELLAFINVTGQMFLMDRFFDGEFMRYGIKVINFAQMDQEDRVDPMIYMFPRMTKCTFFKYGLSGEVERLDSICILPLNIVNEKIYIFLWFWFIILSIATLILVSYRVVTVFSPNLRKRLLKLHYHRLIDDADIDTIVRNTHIGDWFLLYMIGVNIDSRIFRDVLRQLARRLEGEEDEKTNLNEP